MTKQDTSYENRIAAVEAAKKKYTVVEAQTLIARRFEIYENHGQETEHFVCNGLNKADAEKIAYLLNQDNQIEVENLKEELDLR